MTFRVVTRLQHDMDRIPGIVFRRQSWNEWRPQDEGKAQGSLVLVNNARCACVYLWVYVYVYVYVCNFSHNHTVTRDQ